MASSCSALAQAATASGACARRAALTTATEELATVQRELDDAQRRHTKLELRRAAAADALRAAEAELASEADRT